MKHDFADFRLLSLRRCALFCPLLRTAKRAAVLCLVVLLFAPSVIGAHLDTVIKIGR